MNSSISSNIIFTPEHIRLLVKLSQNNNCNFVKNCHECPLHLLNNIANCIKHSKLLAIEQLNAIDKEQIFDILL